MIANIDAWLGRYIELLHKRGQLDNTLIVYSSDHGEMLGDYGQWQKLSPLQSSIGVPLIVAGPGIAQQTPNHAPITTLYLHATFLDIAGVDPGDVDSQSMLPLFADETDRHREAVCSGLSAWRLAYDGRYKLIRGYHPAQRSGGHAWEPMAVDLHDARALQRDRPLYLYDTATNGQNNLVENFPDIVAQLDAHLTT